MSHVHATTNRTVDVNSPVKYWESGSPSKSPVKLMSYTNYFETRANVFLATSLDAPTPTDAAPAGGDTKSAPVTNAAPAEEKVKNDENRLAMLTLLGVVELLAQKKAYIANAEAAAKALFRDVSTTLRDSAAGADGTTTSASTSLTSVLRKSEWNSFLSNLNTLCAEDSERNRTSSSSALATAYDSTELPAAQQEAYLEQAIGKLDEFIDAEKAMLFTESEKDIVARILSTGNGPLGRATLSLTGPAAEAIPDSLSTSEPSTVPQVSTVRRRSRE